MRLSWPTLSLSRATSELKLLPGALCSTGTATKPRLLWLVTSHVAWLLRPAAERPGRGEALQSYTTSFPRVLQDDSLWAETPQDMPAASQSTQGEPCRACGRQGKKWLPASTSHPRTEAPKPSALKYFHIAVFLQPTDVSGSHNTHLRERLLREEPNLAPEMFLWGRSELSESHYVTSLKQTQFPSQN